MDSYGIEVFHVTYGDGGIARITYYFVLDLFVSLNTLFNKNLTDGRKFKSSSKKLYKFFFIICKSAACSAESKCRAKNYGISDLLGRLFTLFDAVNND